MKKTAKIFYVLATVLSLSACASSMMKDQVLARSDVHATVHLTGVGRDNLTADLARQGCCQGCLSAGRGSKYGYHLLHNRVQM